jgi:hypothetical protein
VKTHFLNFWLMCLIQKADWARQAQLAGEAFVRLKAEAARFLKARRALSRRQYAVQLARPSGGLHVFPERA